MDPHTLNLLNNILALLPMELLVSTLGDALTEYKNNPSKDNMDSLGSACHSILVKQVLIKKGGDIDPKGAARSLSEEVNEIKRATEFFKTDKN